MAILSASSSTSLPSQNVRLSTLVISTIGLIFNIVISVIARRKAEGALGVTFLGLSGIVSFFQLACRSNRRPVLNVLIDAFFAIGLLVLYILVLIFSSAVREHIVGVYANFGCLVSSLFHGYSFLKAAEHVIQTRTLFGRGAAYCPHCSAKAADYKTAPVEEEPEVERGNITLSDAEYDEVDERTPLYRDSEDPSIAKV